MSSYPTSVDTFAHKDEGPGNYLFAKDVNDITTAIATVQTVLGLNPAGAAPSVAELLVVIQDDHSALSLTVDGLTTDVNGLTTDVSTLSASVDALLVMGGGTGATGPTGPPGQPRYVGSGAPTPLNTPGSVPGDRYLDEMTGYIYTLS